MKTLTLKLAVFFLIQFLCATTGEAAPGITTSGVRVSVCRGGSIDVSFTVSGTFLNGNVFTAQLSDLSGGFASPTDIGSLTDTISGTITAIIPPGAALGTGYRVRVVSNSPVVIGSDNGSDLTVKPCVTIQTSAVRGSPFCTGASVGVPFTANGVFDAGNVFTAQLSNSTGNFSNPTDIGSLTDTVSGTIATTIPTGTTAGSNYRIRVMSSSPPYTGSGNGNKLSIVVCADWTGVVDDNWFNTANWSSGFVPTTFTNVIIPDVAPNEFPVIQGPPGTVAHVKNLTIRANAQLTNDATLDISGDISSFGSLAGSGTLSFSGSAQALHAPLTFNGALFLKPGSKLNTNNFLTLNSGASLMHGAGTPGGGGSVTGTITIRRTGSGNPHVYNYWSSPVQNASANLLNGTVYYYDPDYATDQSVPGMQAGWLVAGATMYKAVGYASQGAGTVSFSGNPNNETMKAIIKKNASTGVAWNLIGNPYPSAVDASAFVSANAGLITGSLYFWDDDGSGGSGWSSQDYAVWNGAGAIGGPNSGRQFNGHIASGQSFFVEKVAAGTSIVKFENNMRSTQNNVFFRSAPIERLWVSATSPDNDYKETLIAFMSEAGDDYDLMYDARKLGINSKIALYTKIGNEHYAIQALAPLTSSDKHVVLGLDAGVAGNYTLHLKTIENMDETVTVILEDTETGHVQNLSMNSAYTFYTDAGNHDSRFILHFNPAIQIDASDATCFGNDGVILIRQDGSKVWNYMLTDSEGRVIERRAGFNGSNTLTGLTPGNYTLALTSDDGFHTLKTIVLKGKIIVKADFTVSSPWANVNEEVFFSGISNGATMLEWNFGDGSPVVADEHPSHAYNAPGLYQVKLTAFNDDCSTEKIAEVSVANKQDEPTGIIHAEHQDDFYAYSQGENICMVFSFSQPQMAQVTVYDVAGRQLMSERLFTEGRKQINVEYAAGSCLFLRVDAPGQSFTRKILMSR